MNAGNAQNPGETNRTLDEFFSGFEDALPIFYTLHAAVVACGAVDMLVTKSQIAFRRTKAFAWAWVPDRYLGGGHAPLVLSLSFSDRNGSPRWKTIVEPAPGRFMHHLELYSPAEVDEEVRGWLQKAWQAAA